MQVETVRIGDRLTFRIEIPEKTPYGIFARWESFRIIVILPTVLNIIIIMILLPRNCVAMAKDSRSTFPIIDENGCPVDPTIFPRLFCRNICHHDTMIVMINHHES